MNENFSKPQVAVLKVVTNLTFWVFIAIAAGIYLGHFFPEQALQMEPVGKYFIELIKVFIGPILSLIHI